ncbi:MAG TPA: 2-hydroxyacyl-CoA dehydratase family protein [Sphingomonas sp.]|nr:2-hydroxyacyl-CoA dehydratase family protein [Sphingomonas sp.]
MGAADSLKAIADAFADPDAVAAGLAAAGHKVIRTIGSDAPFTLLRAAGFAAVRVAPANDRLTPHADAVIGPATGRKRAHALLEWLLDPVHADTPILITRADSDQPQLFAALRERRRLGEPVPHVFAMLDLLHQPRDSSARYNRQRIDQLCAWLESLGGRRVTDAGLATAAAEEAHVRTRIRHAQSLRQEARLSGTDMLRIVSATAILPPGALRAHLDTILADRAALPKRSGKRLWIAGTAHESDRHYAAIEADGALIVGETHDWGLSRIAHEPPATLDAASAPPLHAPLPARSMAETARTAHADATAAGAEAILHLVLDRDEAAPWLLAPLRTAGSLRIDTHAIPEGEPPAPRAASPTPPQRSRKLLRSAASFGAYQRDWFASIREEAASGAPFAVVNANAPQEILRAFGIPFVVNQWWASIVAAKQQAGRYKRLLAAHDYPADVEAYSAQALAAAFDADAQQAPWGGLPTPDFVHAVTSSDATAAIFEAMADVSGAQPFLYERTVDPRDEIETRWWEAMPDRWDEALEPQRIDLLVTELREVIARIEAATGRRFDEDRFRAVMALVDEQEEYYRATRDLIARTVPAPIGIVDSMPATMVPQWHRGSAWARDAARAFHDEVAERVAAGQAAVPDERIRLMWVGRGLWSDTAFYQKWEESHGAVFVWSMYLALAADGYIRRFDRDRDPLRALAARFLTMGDELRMPSWAGPWHVHEAETHQVDGAVALSDADPFVLRALTAAGIPVLELGVDNYALGPGDAGALDDRVTAFIEGPAARMAARRAEKS